MSQSASKMAVMDYETRKEKLFGAIRDGNPTALLKLLAAHPSVSLITTGFKKTALHKAVELGQGEIVEVLLQVRPSLASWKDHFGRTPEDYADGEIKSLFQSHKTSSVDAKKARHNRSKDGNRER